jgi:hypothetical protein
MRNAIPILTFYNAAAGLSCALRRKTYGRFDNVPARVDEVRRVREQVFIGFGLFDRAAGAK